MIGQQLSFAEFAPPPPTENLFLAIVPPPKERALIFDQARALRGTLGLRGQLRPKACLHVSLIGFARWRQPPRSLVESLDKVLCAFRSGSLDVTFDYATSFAGGPNQRPFVLRGEAGNFHLQALYQNLAGALKAAKLMSGAPRVLTPHVTLLYDNQLVAERAIAPIRWTVRDIVLVRSLVGQSRHVIEGRWPLMAGDTSLVA